MWFCFVILVLFVTNIGVTFLFVYLYIDTLVERRVVASKA